DYSRDLRPAKWGSTVILRSCNSKRPMSALGQKQTLGKVRLMSALPPKADIGTQPRDVRFVPKADIAERRQHFRFVPNRSGLLSASRALFDPRPTRTR